MKSRLLATLLCAATVYAEASDQPSGPPQGDAAQSDICATLNNEVIGPSAHVITLPLLKGDPAHPTRACSVAWTALSPKNQPLPIVGCYQGRLLQVQNNTACGSDTGFLWVERSWVVTRADKPRALTQQPHATCEALDTSTSAATRDYHPECVPQKSPPQPKSNAAAPPAR